MNSVSLHTPIITSEQGYYSARQIVLPLNLGLKLNSDDPVFSFHEVVKGVNLRQYLHFNEKGRTGYDNYMMLEVVLFANMNNITSLRKIAQACQYDIRFMWLAHEKKPSHEAFKRFINNNLRVNIKQIFADINRRIAELDTVDTSIVYIDGTKIEANATKFSFVWKKATITFLGRLKEKITKRYPYIQSFLHIENKMVSFEIEKEPSIQLLQDIHYVLEEIKLESNIEFAHGIGKRKSEFQKFYEEFSGYLEKMERYEEHIRICGERNSYSKTDHDATFMHGKEDYYMKTGIFKPYYNLQLGLSSEYIWVVDVNQRSADMKTFIPLMNVYHDLYNCYPKKSVADAGYGSYENYMFCASKNIEPFMKYPMYAKEKEKKFKKDIYRKENYRRDDIGNWLCPAGHVFEHVYDKQSRKGNYLCIDQIYRVTKCKDCPLKKDCITGSKKKLEDIEEKSLAVNPVLMELQSTVRNNLESPEGIQLRINRSIQAEGAFGVIKEDNGYDRVHRRGLEKVTMEMYLVAIGFNLMKYHRRKYREEKLSNSIN